MPVLPLEGSSSTWSGLPGTSVPSASAASTSASATRSFTDPVGLWPSSLTSRRTDSDGLSELTSTIGVSPTSSSTEP